MSFSFLILLAVVTLGFGAATAKTFRLAVGLTIAFVIALGIAFATVHPPHGITYVPSGVENGS